MKKREIKNMELEQIFNKIVEQTPIISEKQVSLLLNEFPKTKLKNAEKRFFQDRLNTWLLSSVIVLIIVVATLTWFNPERQSNKSVVQNNAKNIIEPTPVFADTITNTKLTEISQNKVKEEPVLKETSTKTNAVVVQPKEKSHYPIFINTLIKSRKYFRFRQTVTQ